MKKTSIGMLVSLTAAGALFLTGCPDDLAETAMAAYAFADVDADSVCDTCGQGVDADGDGVCDNFIDEDGDGYCDNRQSHARLGWGLDGYQFRDGNADGLCDLCGSTSDGVLGRCGNFVDQDGDGLCDNHQSHMRLGLGPIGYRFQDANGDGQCDLCDGRDLNGDGVCDNFVDADGDGVCDHNKSHMRLGWGAQGYQFQDGNGDGRCDRCGEQDGNGDGVCDSFVDENGDGQCDRHNSHEQHGNGNGHGGGGGGGGQQ